MKRLLRLVLAVLLAVALLLSVTHANSDSSSSGDEVDLEVQMVQVLHRHGARASTPRFNTSLICTEAPCGYLTWAGIEMLLNTGAFLRSRYNTDTSVVSAPMFPSPNYDLDVSYSRSTDVLRTLQSAEAFLRGFFPNTSSLYAAIHSVADSTDVLLNSNTQPWLNFFYSYNKALLRDVCNPLTDALYPDWTEITNIGKEIYYEGYCNNYVTRSDCVRMLFDIGAAKAAVGELSMYPLLEANLEKFRNITRVLFAYEYHYTKSDPLMFKQGGRGQPFLKQLVANMDSAIAGTNTFKLMEYSAHDTTLAPVWGSLGDTTDNGMLPPFAQILVAELLKSKSTGAMSVRVLRGHPGQTPDTDFAFGWDATWQLQCMDAWGNAYNATDNVCPLADFKRYVRYSEPADPRGYCYLDAASIAIAACPSGGVLYNTPTTLAVPSTCRFYRDACPSFACASGYSLNSVSLQCVCAKDTCLGGTSTSTGTSTVGNTGTGSVVMGDTAETTTVNGASASTSNKSGLGAGAVVGISLATFCVGAAIAVAVTAIVCLCMQRRRHGFQRVQSHPPKPSEAPMNTEAV